MNRKRKRDVDGEADDRGQRRVDALLLQVGADDRADDLGADDLELAGRSGLLERVDRALGVLLEAEALLRRRRPAAAGSGSRARAGVAVLLDDLVARQRVERLADRVLVHRLLELEHDERAAREVDAERHAAAGEHRRPGRR